MIREISLKSFRNYDDEKVSFQEGINVFLGKNGQGKTNLLEAVYFLGMLSSFRRADTSQLIKNGEDYFSIKGLFTDDHAESLIVEKGEKGWSKIGSDGKVYKKKTDYIGRVKMVVFSADDMELIEGPPDARRRYMDRVYFNIFRKHLKRLKTFKKILKQRNLLLKKAYCDRHELDVWSEKLAFFAGKVIEGRMELLEILNGKLKINHPFTSTDKISLKYVSKGISTAGPDNIEKDILDRLLGLRKEEQFRKTTLVGPHRDDVAIIINGMRAKAFSSRGEMRSILLAIKTAEVEAYREHCDRAPLVLLDDVASELDIDRRTHLFSYLRQRKDQVLITTTEAENLPLMDYEKKHIYKVEKGKILH